MPLVSQSATAEISVLDQMLLSGGDSRIALDPLSRLNVYGCSPNPQYGICDLSSSTASSISPQGHRRALEAWHKLKMRPCTRSFDIFTDDARSELVSYFGLNDQRVDVVFSPSGTDAQLLTLFLIRSLLGTPLVTIIAGADQTGRGTTHTAKGRHFTDRGANKKGQPVDGLAPGVYSVEIPFSAGDGGAPRSLVEIDMAVVDAVEFAIAKGAHVLLQAMASSKLGWTAPSEICIAELQRRWPDRICVVIDACQMRIGSARLRHHLAQNRLVLMTGSKFFCGPPFSGAILIPQSLGRAFAAISQIPLGLRTLSSRFDWPARYQTQRYGFPPVPNIGQWLRWEAALEEMRAYHAVPLEFRTQALARFAAAIPALIAASPELVLHGGAVADPDPSRDEEFSAPTIFPFGLKHAGRSYSYQECTTIHRLLTQNLAPSLTAVAQSAAASRPCRLGQPVAVGSNTAVMRLSSSARMVARCWSPHAASATANIEAEIASIALALDKLQLVVRHISCLAA
jgi:hypothetical protein